MRKILAFVLAICITMTVVLSFPMSGALNGVVSAEADGYMIDFENGQSAYAESNKSYGGDIVDIVSKDGNHYINIDTLQTYRGDTSDFDWNRNTMPAIFRLPDKGGENSLYLEKGGEFNVSFKLRKNKELTEFAYGEKFSSINAALVFSESYDFRNESVNTIPKYIADGKLAVITENISIYADSDWVTYSGKISVPSSGYAAFMLYGVGGRKGQNTDIDIDDIVIRKYVSYDSVTVNFENKQTAYAENNKSYGGDIVDIVSNDGNHYINIDTLQTYRGDTSDFDWNRNTMPAIFRLPDEGGENNLYLEKGGVFNVSFKLRKNKELTEFAYGEKFDSISAALVFSESYDFGNASENTIPKYIADGNLAVITENISIYADSDWVTYSGKIGVPSSGYVAFLLYGVGGRKGQNTDIDIDDIEIRRYVSSDSVTVDFENGQTAYAERNKSYGGDIVDIVSKDGNHYINIDTLQTYRRDITDFDWNSNTMPAIFRLPDEDGENGLYLERGGTFNVSFKLRKNREITQFAYDDKFTSINAALVFSSGYDFGNSAVNTIPKYMADGKLAVIIENISTGIDTDWVSYSGTISVPSSGYAAFMLYGVGGRKGQDTDIDIDDISIQRNESATVIHFDTAGGTKIEDKVCAPGSRMPTVFAPTKEGYLFEGWYTDSECLNPLRISEMPEEDLYLYAKWVKAFSDVPTYRNDFEADEFYKNNGKDNLSDNIASEKDEIRKGGAYEGDSYLFVENDTLVAFPQKENGEGYQLIAGRRYHISFAARVETGTLAHLYVSQMVPSTGLTKDYATEIESWGIYYGATDIPDNTWGVHERYFIPSVSGKLYLCITGNSIEVTGGDIDDILIEEADPNESSLVTYVIDDRRVSYFGKIGSELTDYDVGITEKNQSISGWHIGSLDGPIYTDTVFPKNDTVLYTEYISMPDTSNASSDWSQTKVIDFEDTENVRKYYSSSQVNQTVHKYRVNLLTNSPERAHTGNNCFYISHQMFWNPTWNARFKFYDKDSVGNNVYLEPNSIYKISFWLKCDIVVSTASFTVAAFPGHGEINSYYGDAPITFTTAANSSSLGKWVKYETMLITSDEVSTLGMVIDKGPVTAYVDDITVSKVKMVTLSFESNGGTYVNPVSMLSYRTAVAPPHPEREGYTFLGWYSDAALTVPFKFNKTMVYSDMKLYAKWEKNAVREISYEEKTSYTYEDRSKENPEYDAAPDEKLSITDNDVIKKTQSVKKTPDEPKTSMLPIIIAASACLIAAVGAVLWIVIRKRNRKA